jgi:hypothetical protein
VKRFLKVGEQKLICNGMREGRDEAVEAMSSEGLLRGKGR